MAKTFQVIAGPCAVESREQIKEIAGFLKSCGMNWIKGGSWKPLTWGPKYRKPYQKYLGQEGMDILWDIAGRYKLKTLSELHRIDPCIRPDRIQVGARNMQNFSLLDNLNHLGQPLLLKRHFGCSLEELYASTTYLTNCDVWVCERGVVVPHTHGYRYLLDYQAVIEWKMKYDHPIFMDVSHWIGVSWAEQGKDVLHVVRKAAKAAKVIGADGILVDIHLRPKDAWVDPWQALTFEEFQRLLEELEKIPC